MNREDLKKNPISKGLVKRLLTYVTGKYKVLLGIVFFCIVVASVTSVLGNMFIKNLIDDYIVPILKTKEETGAADFSGLLKWVRMVAVLFIFGVIANFFQGQIMLVIANNVLRNVRGDMFKHMQTLPIRYFDTHSHGDVMSHYTNDVDTLRQMISQSFPQMMSSSITIVATLAAMIYTSWHLTIVVLLGTFTMIFLMGKIGGKSATFFMKQQASLGDVNGYIEEMVNGQKVVKVFTYEERAKKAFDGKNEELCQNATSANIFANILMPIMGNIGNVLYVLVAFIGGFLAIKCGLSEVITIGVIGSFLQLTKAFVMPVSQVSQQMNAIIMAMAGADRIFKLLDEKPEEDDGYVTLVHCKKEGDTLTEVPEEEELSFKRAHGGKDTDGKTSYVWAWKHPHQDGTLTYAEVRGDVRLFDVDFSYDGKKQVLYDVSLYAKPGQKIAFVGATGAGKTTITNLINRFYDIADGKIRYDDININKIKKADLRHSLGIVLQDTNLFTGSVMENIRYGNLKATDEECIEAAKLANAHDFISKLPQGYDTELTANGAELSQGQRQLIAIARAAVADPPVMILDEATSSIDTRTEAIVQRGMDALMEDRTVFVIAHRLSTVQNSKAIMVLENGHIIERGDHQSLIAEKGKYYQLYTGAFELE
ncbi:MAG: ABC transporter ATP-binding protein [Clostridiales bacterium]|nr:ABC transporter ATP-binding protein [Clostridiales bacterium]